MLKKFFQYLVLAAAIGICGVSLTASAAKIVVTTGGKSLDLDSLPHYYTYNSSGVLTQDMVYDNAGVSHVQTYTPVGGSSTNQSAVSAWS